MSSGVLAMGAEVQLWRHSPVAHSINLCRCTLFTWPLILLTGDRLWRLVMITLLSKLLKD